MSQTVKIGEVVTSIGALATALQTRFGGIDTKFNDYLLKTDSAASANTIAYQQPVEELLIATPANTAAYVDNKIHIVLVTVTTATVVDELTLVVPNAADIIEGWVPGGMNGLLTVYAYDVGANVGEGKAIVRKLEVNGHVYLQVGETYDTSTWGAWTAVGGGGDAETLQGKTVQEILDMAAAAEADFSTAPLNVFQGVDYTAMAALGAGRWIGKANASAMSPGTLVGYTDCYLEVTSVVSGAITTITRVVTVPDGKHVESIDVDSEDGVSSGFGRLLTTRDYIKDLPYNSSQTVDQYIALVIQDLDNLQQQLTDFIAAKATGAEVITGTDNVKYTTALAVATAISKAIEDLVDGAPTALDTLNKLAAALSDQDDELTAILTQLDNKLDKTAKAADSDKLNGKTQAQLTASNAEMTTGTETGKFATPAGVKSVMDPLAARVTTNEGDIDLLLTELTTAFNNATTTVSS